VSVRRGKESFEVAGHSSRSVLLRCFGLLILAASIQTRAFSQSLDGPPAVETGAPATTFDIPSQPLAAALDAYGTKASVQLFYDAGLVSGRISNAIRGTFSRTAALRMLLVGTGLAQASFDPGTITIVPLSKQLEAVDLRPAKARAIPFTPYFALIQKKLRSALCQTTVAETDASEIRAQLWIAPSGDVAQAALLSSTGSTARDRVYLDVLGALAIGAPPPSMPQPVTLVILPRSSPGAAECRSVDTPASARWLSHE
jgi:hypothetical protein